MSKETDERVYGRFITDEPESELPAKNGLRLVEQLMLKFRPQLLIETSKGWQRVIGPPELVRTLGFSIGGGQVRLDKKGSLEIIGSGINIPNISVDYNSVNGISFDEMVFAD